jgi:hypothetical protein
MEFDELAPSAAMVLALPIQKDRAWFFVKSAEGISAVTKTGVAAVPKLSSKRERAREGNVFSCNIPDDRRGSSGRCSGSWATSLIKKLPL